MPYLDSLTSQGFVGPVRPKSTEAHFISLQNCFPILMQSFLKCIDSSKCHATSSLDMIYVAVPMGTGFGQAKQKAAINSFKIFESRLQLSSFFEDSIIQGLYLHFSAKELKIENTVQ